MTQFSWNWIRKQKQPSGFLSAFPRTSWVGGRTQNRSLWATPYCWRSKANCGDRGQGDSKMMATWTLMKNGKTLMSLPRVGFLRAIMINHIYHHRGQLSVYLRLLDLPCDFDLRSGRRRKSVWLNGRSPAARLSRSGASSNLVQTCPATPLISCRQHGK